MPKYHREGGSMSEEENTKVIPVVITDKEALFNELRTNLILTLEHRLAPRSDKEIIEIVDAILSDLSLDHSHWQEVVEIRKDMSFLRDTRKRCENLGSKAALSLIYLLIIAIAGLLLFGGIEYVRHSILGFPVDIKGP